MLRFGDVVVNNVPGRLTEEEILVCLIPASSIWDPVLAGGFMTWHVQRALARK